MSYFYKIKNENNIPLQKNGKRVVGESGIRQMFCDEPKQGDGIYLTWADEDFEAKFDRDVEGLKIYNVTKSIKL